MSVAAMSVKAFFEIKVEGITSNQEKRVYRLISSSPIPMTRKEAAVQLFLDASTVGGRANALVESGHLIERPSRKCKVTGRTAGTLEAV